MYIPFDAETRYRAGRPSRDNHASDRSTTSRRNAPQHVPARRDRRGRCAPCGDVRPDGQCACGRDKSGAQRHTFPQRMRPAGREQDRDTRDAEAAAAGRGGARPTGRGAGLASGDRDPTLPRSHSTTFDSPSVPASPRPARPRLVPAAGAARARPESTTPRSRGVSAHAGTERPRSARSPHDR